MDGVPVAAVAPSWLERTVGLTIGAGFATRADGPAKQRLRNGYSAALVTRTMAEIRSVAASRALKHLGRVDGVVQMGTGMLLATDAPVVVYDDMTVRQASRYPYRNWSTLPHRALESRVRHQRRVYEKARVCCFTTTWGARSVIDEYHVPRQHVRVVGSGSPEVPRLIKRDWSRPRFLFVGVDWPRKNGPRVIEAFRAVRAAYPDATLDLVGGHPPVDAPGVTGHGLLKRSDATESQKLRALFDDATVFVMPSLFEPGGIVFGEAAAAGIPSICGTNGGSADLVGDGGLGVDPLDDDALRAAMLTLADPDAAREAGDRASRRAALLSWDAVVRRLVHSIDPAFVDGGGAEDIAGLS